MCALSNITNLTMEVASLQEDLVDFFRRYGNSINLPETEDFGIYNGAKTLRFQSDMETRLIYLKQILVPIMVQKH